MSNYERDRALMEGARNAACDDYFAARPQIDCIDRRRVYEAGFQAGAASRDAEVVSLTNQRDYEYVRAENAEQDRLLIKIAPEDAEIAGLMDDAARYRFLRKFLSSKDLAILTGRGERNEPDEQYAIDCVVDVAIARARKP